MKKYLKPSTIEGNVKAPASKSMLQRALAMGLLAKTTTRISNVTYSSDCKAALQVIEALGARTRTGLEDVLVEGGLHPTGEILNCGEAGLSIRMFAPIAALWHKKLTLTGVGSLLSRPVSMIENPLKQLDVQVKTNNGFPPLTVQGPLCGGEAKVDGSVSSQLLTGLLIALPVAPSDSVLRVDSLKSTPYIDMTIAGLKSFGVEVRHSDYKEFYIKGNQAYTTADGEYWVEGDWSGASFLLVAGAVGGTVTVEGLNTASPQADRRIIDALKAAGAEISMSGHSVTVSRKRLDAFSFDATHCPDLFPPLAALACNCSGESVIKGVERLYHKESNRAEALLKEFNGIGGNLQVEGNRMIIRGASLGGGTIDSHNDHRIAMAGAIAAIKADGNISIHEPQCVAKSYPGFFSDFQAIGGNIYE
jgi:3-phosphoshikimate 1-carboxyvinyltransferase